MKKQLSEKTKLLRLIMFWGVCLLVGFGIGWVIASVSKMDSWDPAAYFEAAAPALSLAVVTVYVLLNAGILGWAWWLTCQCKSQAGQLTQEDEERLDALEKRLSMPMVALSVLTIVDMAMYPIIISLLLHASVPKAVSDVLFALDCVVFFAALFGGFALNKRCVDIEKQLNPEKRGSLLDLSFQKTWLASCDEAQKQQIYEAGFHAFRMGSSACMVLWMVSVLLMFLLDTGIVPTVMVCAVWLTLEVSYFAACNGKG